MTMGSRVFRPGVRLNAVLRVGNVRSGDMDHAARRSRHRRIISLVPAVTEMLFASGAGVASSA